MTPPAEPRRVLIAGCGYVGGRLAEMLVADGCTVWGLTRSGTRLPAGVRGVGADLGAPAGWPDLPDPIDALVFAAGRTRGDGDGAYAALFATGLDALLRRYEEADSPPRRVLMVSSTGVYGSRPGEWVDEETPASPERTGPRYLAQAEARLETGPLPACSVRLSGIYGPGRTRLIDRVREGEAEYDPEAPEWVNHIHREDAAGILRFLLRASSLPPVVLGTDAEPVRRAELLQWLAAQIGAPAPRAVPGSSARRPRSGGKRCRNTRLQAMRYPYAYPTFREGYPPLFRPEH